MHVNFTLYARVSVHSSSQWRRQLQSTGARAPPRLPTISFLVHFEVNLTANYRNIVRSARSAGADVNNSQLFRIDQYCISHKTISHRAAAAPGPEVRHE